MGELRSTTEEEAIPEIRWKRRFSPAARHSILPVTAQCWTYTLQNKTTGEAPVLIRPVVPGSRYPVFIDGELSIYLSSTRI